MYVGNVPKIIFTYDFFVMLEQPFFVCKVIVVSLKYLSLLFLFCQFLKDEKLDLDGKKKRLQLLKPTAEAIKMEHRKITNVFDMTI